jgi:hypothetical protein
LEHPVEETIDPDEIMEVRDKNCIVLVKILKILVDNTATHARMLKTIIKNKILTDFLKKHSTRIKECVAESV